ncbi:2-hydroxyacid dehydrogenase [Gramella sp. AN32]|uniref:2-hydroxyacid dehydrogenase n=1 Tax=Christiangramia antarctica TaxID=2058158 RepID=A0ABW5X414_9FLAO|nr:2-hydroxyacid dehydrogenase [Gramella sp. AN32]MCM4156373.1 hydroxyacid dehydrogenase [Gramella sp. AN32]
MTVLHADANHPLLIKLLEKAGYSNIEGYTMSPEQILDKQELYDGIILRSRFEIDSSFLEKAPNLKFIGRVGAGLESIDIEYAEKKGVKLFSAPEGNRNAVGEHSLGMLLSLFNKLNKANAEVKSGQWNREDNRGHELGGKTVGLIGYGNMGKSFAKKLKGFDVEVIFHDIKTGIADENATQVELSEIFEKADVLSLHTPWTPETNKMVNAVFISKFKKPFWLINTARGKSVVTNDLVEALKFGKILGAGLDVLEYEKSSFENLFSKNDQKNQMPQALQDLINMENVLLTPHVAGWTFESQLKLAETIAHKIIAEFGTF